MHRASLILFFYAGGALAHPDHGASGWLSAALSHLLSERDHLAPILAPLMLGLVWIVRSVVQARAGRSARSKS
jgi:hydrogenase/urease accessory protein HupE